MVCTFDFKMPIYQASFSKKEANKAAVYSFSKLYLIVYWYSDFVTMWCPKVQNRQAVRASLCGWWSGAAFSKGFKRQGSGVWSWQRLLPQRLALDSCWVSDFHLRRYGSGTLKGHPSYWSERIAFCVQLVVSCKWRSCFFTQKNMSTD